MKKSVKFLAMLFSSLVLAMNIFAGDTKPAATKPVPTVTLDTKVAGDHVMPTPHKTVHNKHEFVLAKHGFTNTNKLAEKLTKDGWAMASPSEIAEVMPKLKLSPASAEVLKGFVLMKRAEQQKVATAAGQQ